MTRSQREVLEAFAHEVKDLANKYGMSSFLVSASKIFVSTKSSMLSEEVVAACSGPPEAIARIHAYAGEQVEEHAQRCRRKKRRKADA